MAFFARRLIKLRCGGLANIILGDRPVMPELIQEACTVDNIVAEIMPLLRNEPVAQQQRDECAKLRALLGHEQAAVGVVDMVEDLIN